jgi:hypothetical protein
MQDYFRIRQALFVAALIIGGLFSSICQAYSGGTGTAENPYQIATKADLLALAATPSHYAKSFILTADIDLEDQTFSTAIIAPDTNSTTSDFQGTYFTGTFDGNNHIISHFAINGASNDYLGLFGYIGFFGKVENLELLNMNINGTSDSNCIGGLAGFSRGTITDCRVAGNVGGYYFVGGLVGYQSFFAITLYCHVSVNITGEYYIGGLIGQQEGASTIESCSTTGSVTGVVAVGGLAGYNTSGIITDSWNTCSVYGLSDAGGLTGYLSLGTITNSYNTGTVNGESEVGGLVGHQNTDCTITNCYNAGDISGIDPYNGSIGGLAGTVEYGHISNCYNTGTIRGYYDVGGLLGGSTGTLSTSYNIGEVISDNPDQAKGLIAGNNGIVFNCFWDMQTSGQSLGGGGKGRSTEQMKQAENYTGWNCDEPVWILDPGNDYPRLFWEATPGTVLPTRTLDEFIEGVGTISNPYHITTCDQLNKIGLFPSAWNKIYSLEADIDMSVLTGVEFNKIGISAEKAFSGTFDGNHHVISNFTYQTGVFELYVALFGYTQSASISNLKMTNVNLFSEGYYSGSIIGYQDAGILDNCSSSGTIHGGYTRIGGLIGVSKGTVSDCRTDVAVSGDYEVGGMIGAQYSGAISNCQSVGNVSGIGNIGGLAGESSGTIIRSYAAGDITGSNNLGGLIGYSNSIISECRSTGNIKNLYSEGRHYGGLVGYSSGAVVACYSTGKVSGAYDVGGLAGVSDGEISNCYSISDVQGSKNNLGGLVGILGSQSSIMNCYAASTISGVFDNAGCLIGYCNPESVVLNSFWNNETCGWFDSRGVGLTSEQMMTISMFIDSGWDFTDTWTICQGTNYPRFVWQIGMGDFACPDGVNTEDLDSVTTCWLETVRLRSDLNNDGFVNLADFTILAQAWLPDVPIPTCPECEVNIDINGDHNVDPLDLVIMAQEWLLQENTACRMADLNADGQINLADYAVFAQHWLEGI